MLSFFQNPFALRLSLAATSLATLYLLFAQFTSGPGARAPSPGDIVHIVLFQYAPGVSAGVKASVADSFLALRDACVRDGARYILAIDGGPNHSEENKTHGMEHGFVVTFKSIADRDYYVRHDPAHALFRASLPEKVAYAVVFDFTSRAFAQAGKATEKKQRRRSDEIHVRTV